MAKSVISVKESDTLLHASDLLIRHKFFSLCVVDEEERLTGLVNRSRILLGVLQELEEEKNENREN
jgi:CBS-domain-containing membrane protein